MNAANQSITKRLEALHDAFAEKLAPRLKKIENSLSYLTYLIQGNVMLNSNILLFIFIFSLTSCDNNNGDAGTIKQPNNPAAQSAAPHSGTKSESMLDTSPDSSNQKITSAGIEQQTESQITIPPTTHALVVARKSGCLACHNVDKKLVGPAWRDVAARYSANPQSRELLITKVKTGSKGNWTEITGDVPMPPYSPRVTDGNIELLVDFILSLD